MVLRHSSAYPPRDARCPVLSSEAGAADMFAVGTIMYVLLSGKLPFGNPNEADFARKYRTARISWRIGRGMPENHWEKMPEAVDLIKSLCQPDPSKRLVCAEVLCHPWMTGKSAHDFSEYVTEGLKQVS